MQQEIVKILRGQRPEGMKDSDWEEMLAKIVATVYHYFAEETMYRVINEDSL